MLERKHQLDSLSNGELIDAVVAEVWANLPMSSREGVLLSKLLHRFQELAQIEETPNGITLDGEELWPDVVGEQVED